MQNSDAIQVLYEFRMRSVRLLFIGHSNGFVSYDDRAERQPMGHRIFEQNGFSIIPEGTLRSNTKISFQGQKDFPHTSGYGIAVNA